MIPIDTLEQAQKEIETYKELVLLLKEYPNSRLRYSHTVNRWFIEQSPYDTVIDIKYPYGVGDGIKEAIINFKKNLINS